MALGMALAWQRSLQSVRQSSVYRLVLLNAISLIASESRLHGLRVAVAVRAASSVPLFVVPSPTLG